MPTSSSPWRQRQNLLVHHASLHACRSPSFNCHVTVKVGSPCFGAASAPVPPSLHPTTRRPPWSIVGLSRLVLNSLPMPPGSAFAAPCTHRSARPPPPPPLAFPCPVSCASPHLARSALASVPWPAVYGSTGLLEPRHLPRRWPEAASETSTHLLTLCRYPMLRGRISSLLERIPGEAGISAPPGGREPSPRGRPRPIPGVSLVGLWRGPLLMEMTEMTSPSDWWR